MKGRSTEGNRRSSPSSSFLSSFLPSSLSVRYLQEHQVPRPSSRQGPRTEIQASDCASFDPPNLYQQRGESRPSVTLLSRARKLTSFLPPLFPFHLAQKTASGIFLPTSATSNPLPEATVIAVGPGAPNDVSSALSSSFLSPSSTSSRLLRLPRLIFLPFLSTLSCIGWCSSSRFRQGW